MYDGEEDTARYASTALSPAMIDYIRKFDIELEKEHYYAGEKLKGWVVIENTENCKVRGTPRFSCCAPMLCHKVTVNLGKRIRE